MPIRVPVKGIIVRRNGKQVRAPIGKPFEFTVDELDDINKTNPSAVTKITTVELKDEDQAEKERLKALADNEKVARQHEEQRLRDEQAVRAQRERDEADRERELEQRRREAEKEQAAADEKAAKDKEAADKLASKAAAAKKPAGKGNTSADSL